MLQVQAIITVVLAAVLLGERPALVVPLRPSPGRPRADAPELRQPAQHGIRRRRRPASSVAPFTLLVPVVGIMTAWLVNSERPNVFGALGGALLVLGVAAVALGPRLRPSR